MHCSNPKAENVHCNLEKVCYCCYSEEENVHCNLSKVCYCCYSENEKVHYNLEKYVTAVIQKKKMYTVISEVCVLQ